jgi:uncharacterized repeat protein (TIGR01451 family)
VSGATVADVVPADLTVVSFSCVVTGTGDCDTVSDVVPLIGSGNAISLQHVQLNSGASLTITVVGTATTAGSLTNTATVAVPADTTDPTVANNTASVTTAITPSADLAITKTGPAIVVQGTTVTYTLVATNVGPSNASGATITDTVPGSLTAVSFACVAAGTSDCDTTTGESDASGTGNAISLANVQLDAGVENSVTVTVTGTATATGAFANTAMVEAPLGTTDPTPGNNAATVDTAITPATDLAVVKTGPASAVQGTTVTYTLVVTNAGPSDVVNATITDAVPDNITEVSWTCLAAGGANCDAGLVGTGATGALNAISLARVQINAGEGNSVTIAVTGTASTTGTFPNTATVAPPSGTTDPATRNNTSSVTTTVTPAADLSVVKTGPASVVEGTTATYTVVVANNGPSDVSGATVADTVPAELTGVAFACVATGSADCDTVGVGTGATGTANAVSLDAVRISAGAGNAVTVTVTGIASTTGAITNTASVAPPTGTTDPVAANGTSTVTSTVTPAADLAITKTGPSTVVQGNAVTYTIDVANNGPSSVSGAMVADTVPAGLTGVSFSCAVTGTGDCDTVSDVVPLTGSGNAVSLPNVQLNSGASLTITVVGTATTTGSLTNAATVAAPADTTDPTVANNRASVTTAVSPSADLAILKTGPAALVQGDTVTYTIIVTNNGPSDVLGATIIDSVPVGITGVAWTCEATGIANCDASLPGTGATGAGNAISLANVQVNAGEGNRVTITVQGTASTSGASTNTAAVAPPVDTTDPVTLNDTSSVTTTITPAADLAVTKTGPDSAPLGEVVTYILTVTNNGPSNVSGVKLNDPVPAALTRVSFSCAVTGTGDCDTGAPGNGATGAGNAISLENVQLNDGAALTINVSGIATTVGPLTNTVTVTPPGDTTDPTPDNTASVDTTIIPSADLVITKTGSASALQHTTVVYTITVTNLGPSDVVGAAISDAVPADLEGVSWTCVARGSASCDVASPGTGTNGTGNTISLANVGMNSGPGNSVTITATGTAAATGTFTNTATVVSPEATPDPAPANNSASVDTTIAGNPVVAITKSSVLVDDTAPAGPDPGDTIRYTITATNTGNGTAFAVALSDILDPNLQFVIGSDALSGGAATVTPGPGAPFGGTIAVSGVTIAANQAFTLVYDAIVRDPLPAGVTQIANQAHLSGANFATSRSDDPDTATAGDATVVQLTAAPLISVTKAAALLTDADRNGVPSSGDTLRYDIALSNTGNQAAAGVTLSDLIDSTFPGITDVVASQGSAEVTGQRLTATLGTIPGGGGTATLTYHARIPDLIGNPSVTSVSNQASVIGTNVPATLSDDPSTSAAADATITPIRRTEAPSLRATKSVALVIDRDRSGGASSEDTLEYTVQLENVGTATAGNVAYTDTVDANTTITPGTVTTSRGQITVGQAGGQHLLVALGDVAPGANVTITYRVRVTAKVPASAKQIRNHGRFNAIGIAGTTTDDPTTGAGGDSTDIAVAGTTLLRIRKFAPPRAATRRRTLYTIRITNRGLNAAAGVIVTDQVPRGSAVVGRPRGATVRGRTVTWRIPNLAVGRSITVTLPIRVTGRLGSRLVNSATAVASNASPVRSKTFTRIVRFVAPAATG